MLAYASLSSQEFINNSLAMEVFPVEEGREESKVV